MKFNRYLVGAALAAAAAIASLAGADAAGLYTQGFPSLTAPTGVETMPVDLNTAGQPSTEAITTANLKTYTNGGAIVAATGTSGASTANGERVNITTESLSTAAGAVFTETITDSSVAATSVALCSVGNGTNSAGSPALTTVTPGSGSLVVKVQNIHASAALNGTLTIACRISN